MALSSVNRGYTLAGLVAVTACVPSRPAPAVPADGPVATAGSARGEIPDAGSITWRMQAGSGVAQALIATDSILVVATAAREIVLLNAATGERYWKEGFGGAFAGPPTYADGQVFIATRARDGAVYALDPVRGRRRWDRHVGDVRTGVTVAVGTALIGTAAGDLIALNGTDGSVRWRARLSGPIVSGPIVREGRVYAATQRDTLYRVTLANGTIEARAPLPGTPSAPPALQGDMLIMPLHTREIVALALPAMSARWRAPVDDVPLARPVVDGSDVVVATRAASLWRIAARDGTATRIAMLGGAASAAFTGAGGRYVLGRLDGTLICVDSRGAELWRHDLGTSIVAAPTALDGVLFVPLLDGYVVRIE